MSLIINYLSNVSNVSNASSVSNVSNISNTNSTDFEISTDVNVTIDLTEIIICILGGIGFIITSFFFKKKNKDKELYYFIYKLMHKQKQESTTANAEIDLNDINIKTLKV